MREHYSDAYINQFIEFLNGAPAPQPTLIPEATELPTEEPERSPTPLPPDAQ
jgi:hypothetical protein